MLQFKLVLQSLCLPCTKQAGTSNLEHAQLPITISHQPGVPPAEMTQEVQQLLVSPGELQQAKLVLFLQEGSHSNPIPTENRDGSSTEGVGHGGDTIAPWVTPVMPLPAPCAAQIASALCPSSAYNEYEEEILSSQHSPGLFMSNRRDVDQGSKKREGGKACPLIHPPT